MKFVRYSLNRVPTITPFFKHAAIKVLLPKIISVYCSKLCNALLLLKHSGQLHFSGLSCGRMLLVYTGSQLALCLGALSILAKVPCRNFLQLHAAILTGSYSRLKLPV